MKTSALTSRVAEYLSGETAAVFADFMMEYNRDKADNERLETLLKAIFSHYDEIKIGTKKFAQSAISNGNLSENLCNFLSVLQF